MKRVFMFFPRSEFHCKLIELRSVRSTSLHYATAARAEFCAVYLCVCVGGGCVCIFPPALFRAFVSFLSCCTMDFPRICTDLKIILLCATNLFPSCHACRCPYPGGSKGEPQIHPPLPKAGWLLWTGEVKRRVLIQKNQANRLKRSAKFKLRQQQSPARSCCREAFFCVQTRAHSKLHSLVVGERRRGKWWHAGAGAVGKLPAKRRH